MSREKSIENLQKALSMELTASHQYQLHAAVLDDWGLDLLAKKMREEMQEELGHSDLYLNRILFLKGEPRLTFDKTPVRAESLQSMFKTDMEDEKEAIEFYTKASQQASADSDIGSRQLFEQIVLDEEGHMAWLELQLDLIERMGEAAYIAKHMSSP
ncbi:bacterioferritin [Blastopirellula marina]|uniref:Bacterioferritin n=1 Tax=Blastopirellula marina TaxID=124 RepID=A0A2S8FMA0_9BACT|nr:MULTISPECIES: bacterioferritin [Pirellulaceae]PQO33267.1 bacterioferritin [Blastopirellula marina]RCS52356.1 bacterioferritin [Bremerella cremea]